MVRRRRGRALGIGQNVAAARRRRGLTLEGLAEISSVSRASISAIENGANNPRVQTLWNLADALEVNFGTLIGDSGDDRVFEEGGVSVQLIDRQTSPKVVEAFLMELPAGIVRNANPHVTGVQEHVVVLAGELLTGSSDGPSLLTPGQSVSFLADVAHIYSAGCLDARAIVTVAYPCLNGGIRPNHELNWPQSKTDWEGVVALTGRATVEVQNGVAANVMTFRLPPQVNLEKAASELQKKVATVSSSSSVRRFVLADQDLGILSLYRAPQMARLPRSTQSLEGGLAKRCLKLADLATASPEQPDLEWVQSTVHNTSSLTESVLAAEVLTRNGMPTVPHGVGPIERHWEITDAAAAQQLFEARIDVDAYEAYELVHPAYARQTLALACHLPDTKGLKILDVGTGPGLPLAMLRELRPDLHALAIDPSEVAIQHLTRRFAKDPAVEIRQSLITELDLPGHKFEAVVSIGASHHLDTSIFLATIRDRICDGGLVLISDEMISAFHNREERQDNLIRHHLWYILDTLIEVPKDAHKGDIQLAKRLAQVLPEAMGMVHSNRNDAARHKIRNLFEEVMEIKRPMQPSHPLAVFSRFHLLELQALIAGFDYEVEQKTYPARFKALARANGFKIIDHQRIYATDGDSLEDAGTHLLVMEAI